MKKESYCFLTDEKLMKLVQAGDEQAFVTLYNRHKGLLCTIINRVVNNENDTDEVFSEIFNELWRLAHCYSQEKGKALGWIVTLARRRAIDRLRRKQAYQRAEERFTQEYRSDKDTLEDGASAVEIFDLEMIRDVLTNTSIPEAQRQCLELVMQGYSQREISRMRGIPLGTVKTRIELGLHKAKNILLARGMRNDLMPA